MTIPDLDIDRSAAVLIREHGENAALDAARRADSMLDNGDIEGKRVWLRILAAVKELLRESPADGEAIN